MSETQQTITAAAQRLNRAIEHFGEVEEQYLAGRLSDVAMREAWKERDAAQRELVKPGRKSVR